MTAPTATKDLVDPHARAFYVRALEALNASGIPYMVGGAYAFARYTGIERHTKDLDLFVHPDDARRILEALATVGYQGDMTFPHWLGKAFCGEHFIDIIFGSGNNIARVDEVWFEHAVDEVVLGVETRLIPPEEMLWSKGFIMERERFDGADIAHVLRAFAERLDWDRLLARFDPHWQVLLTHLVLFGFIYPAERDRIPQRVMQRLLQRLTAPVDPEKLCQGTLLSRQQYLTDIGAWGYADARLTQGHMTPAEIAHWTAAIEAPH